MSESLTSRPSQRQDSLIIIIAAAGLTQPHVITSCSHKAKGVQRDQAFEPFDGNKRRVQAIQTRLNLAQPRLASREGRNRIGKHDEYRYFGSLFGPQTYVVNEGRDGLGARKRCFSCGMPSIDLPRRARETAVQ